MHGQQNIKTYFKFYFNVYNVTGSPVPRLEGSDFGPVPKSAILTAVCGKR